MFRLLDEYNGTALMMASENILARDDAKYSFFHESFFDYMYARRMETSGMDLLSLVSEPDGEQDLFRRAQIRQVLVHQRDADRQGYLKNVKSIIEREDIRFHLKETAIAVLGSLDDPTRSEWDIIEPLMSPERPKIARTIIAARRAVYSIGIGILPEQISRRLGLEIKLANLGFEPQMSAHLSGVIRGTVAWFDLLDSMGLLEKWLASTNEQFINLAWWYLRSMQQHRPDRVAELLEPFVGVSELWNQRLQVIVMWASLGAGRRFFDFVLRMIDVGVLDDLRGPIAVNSDFWSVVTPLGA